MSRNGKQLRFAALIRVSTERQEKIGESLRTQRTQLTDDVMRLGGKVIWYGGQEHATPGHEKKELDRLLVDASKGRFDAVIVARTNRWSRDNERSKAGIRVFREHGKRMGIYISWPSDAKNVKWRFSVRGQVVAELHVPRSASELEYIYDQSEKRGKRRDATSSASH